MRTRLGTNWKNGDKGVVITVADTGTGMNEQTFAQGLRPLLHHKGYNRKRPRPLGQQTDCRPPSRCPQRPLQPGSPQSRKHLQPLPALRRRHPLAKPTVHLAVVATAISACASHAAARADESGAQSHPTTLSNTAAATNSSGTTSSPPAESYARPVPSAETAHAANACSSSQCAEAQSPTGSAPATTAAEPRR